MGEDSSLTEEEKKNRKKAERERKRQEARENAEKKKRFGLTPEKKRKLKLLIMKKATEDLKNEAEKKANARKVYLEERVKPLGEIGSMNEAQLVSICKDLYTQITSQEEAKYDLEMKIRKQDYEINELTIKVNDIKGKFIKPTLKKVSKVSKFAKMSQQQSATEKANLRDALKSTGKDKFALKEEVEEEKVNFRDQLKAKGEEE